MSEMAETYQELLQSSEWATRRREVLEAEKYQCCECGEENQPLQVHHRYYLRGRKPWEYPDGALMCVCESCHRELGHLDDELRFTLGNLDSLQLERILASALRMLSEEQGGAYVAEMKAEAIWNRRVFLNSRRGRC